MIWDFSQFVCVFKKNCVFVCQLVCLFACLFVCLFVCFEYNYYYITCIHYHLSVLGFLLCRMGPLTHGGVERLSCDNWVVPAFSDCGRVCS